MDPCFGPRVGTRKQKQGRRIPENMVGFLFLLSASVCLPLLYLAVRVYHSLWWKPKSLEKKLRRLGFQGNPYRIFFGDLKEDVEAMKESWSKPLDLTHNITSRALAPSSRTMEKYGKKSMFWVGTTPTVIIADLEIIRDVLSDKTGHITKPPPNPFMKILLKGFARLEGAEWADRRKMLAPAFHFHRLKGMVPAFAHSCDDLIKRWERLIGSAGGKRELDVCLEFQSFTGDVISRTAFGSTYAQGRRIFELQKEQAALVAEAARSVYFPGLRFLPTAKNKRIMHIDKEIKSILRKLIRKREQSIRMGESCSDDLLGLLVQSSENIGNKNEETNYRITDEDIIEECKLFYFAGQETTSTWLTWTMVVLAMHPDWQEKGREEVLHICGRKKPDMDAINHLKIVTMILNEVLRLYPPGSFLLRRVRKEIRLGDDVFPADVELLLPTILVHHEPEYWGEDADEFNPERFSQGVANASKVQNAFLPFGWGPRICLGLSFANIEAKMAIAMILQHFSFELSPSYAHAPFRVVTLQPQHGAQIILRQI